MRFDGDWPVQPLGEVAENITVGHVGPMATEYVPTGIPFLRSQNVKPYRLELSDVVRITPQFHERLAKSALAAGDVVIVRTGVPGTAAVVPEDLGPANCSDLVIVRPGPRLDSTFLGYAINVVAQEHVNAHLVGAVQQHFNVGSARTMRLPIPPIREQKAIAAVAGSLDDKIALNRRMISKLEEAMSVLFRSWFIDYDAVSAKLTGRRTTGVPSRLYSVSKGRFIASNEGMIPEGWTVGSVQDLGRFVNGRNFTTGASGQGRMVIRIAELNSGRSNSTIFSSAEAAEDNVAQPGDLLFAWSGSLGVYRWYHDSALINQHIFKVVCSSYPQWFAHQHLIACLPFFSEIAAGKATTMGHIKREHLSQASVVLPPQEVLFAASEVFDPLYKRILALARESFTLVAMRDTLLPQLLSGALRVRDVGRVVSQAG